MVAEKWQQIERDAVKRLKPKVDRIKAVFYGDEQYMILSAFYRQNNYHPVYALRGVFGLLIQIPFFIAAYSYLSHLEALNGKAFLFIKNLGAPDAAIPLGGGINILPLVMTAVNCAAGFIYTKNFPVKERIQVFAAAAVFLVLLYNSPAGLVLYWTMNNVFSLIKHIYNYSAFKYKRILPPAVISALSAVLIYFVFARRISVPIIRYAFLSVMAGVSVFMWAFPLIKNVLKKIRMPSYTRKQTLLFFIICCVLLWTLAGLFLPSMLIVSSPQEFSYIDNYTSPVAFIMNTALQAFGLFIFWPLCVYLLFSQESAAGVTKTNTVNMFFAGLAAAVSFCALCNIFIFPGNYGLITLNITFDTVATHSSRDSLINIAALAAVAAFSALLFLKNRCKIIAWIIAVCVFAAAGISTANIVKIENEFGKVKLFTAQKQQKITAVEPVFQLSRTGKNTVIIMLDRATSAFLPQIFAEYPYLNDEYTGFTYYPNTLSFNGYTLLGAPPIFGGYEYTPLELNKRDVPVVKKHNEALLMLPRIFSEAGMKVTVTDPPYPNYSFKDDLRIYEPHAGVKALVTDGVYTKFWLDEHGFKIPSQSEVLNRNILWYSIFRMLPFIFREIVYQGGSWSSMLDGYKLTMTLNAYSVLDYLPRLTGIGDKNENTFLMMVNNTTHDPFLFQAPEYRPSLAVTDYGSGPYSKYAEYHGNAGALMRLAGWFAYLKKENVYDNSRIIIVSDHGAQKDYISRRHPGVPNLYNFNPLLLVKDFNADGSMKTDDVFMTNADVPFLALLGQVENPVNPFTGNPVTTDAKQKPLYVAPSGGVHTGDPLAAKISLNPKEDFYVHGKVLDPASWTRADKK
jgi:YidC/Oxa1 family membrane protein insertase